VLASRLMRRRLGPLSPDLNEFRPLSSGVATGYGRGNLANLSKTTGAASLRNVSGAAA